MKLEKSIEEKEKRIDELKSELDSKNSLYELAVNWYRHNKRNPGDYEILEKHEFTMDKYGRLRDVIENLENQIDRIEKSIIDERTGFKETSDTLTLMEKVVGGTHVQGLVDEEKQRKIAGSTGNGLKLADGSNSEKVDAIGLKLVESGSPKFTEAEAKPSPQKPPPPAPKRKM